MRENTDKGEGVKKSKKFADIICTLPLSRKHRTSASGPSVASRSLNIINTDGTSEARVTCIAGDQPGAGGGPIFRTAVIASCAAIDGLKELYRDEIYSLQNLLSRTQARPGRPPKKEQEEISLNHIQRINLIFVNLLVMFSAMKSKNFLFLLVFYKSLVEFL